MKDAVVGGITLFEYVRIEGGVYGESQDADVELGYLAAA